MSGKLLTGLLIIGAGLLLTIGYLFISSSGEKIEASENLSSPNGEPIIIIGSKGFKPKEITVEQGTQVRWVNEDHKPHHVTFRLGSSIENLTALDQELNKGESVSFKYEVKGRFSYFDKNSSFDGIVNVK